MKASKQWLIVVDYQNSFIPEAEGGTGELWVQWGGLLAPEINKLMQETRQQWGLVVATRDWHPLWHISFASNYVWKNAFETITWDEVMNHIPAWVQLKNSAAFNEADLIWELWAVNSQMLWSDHCVQYTEGAEYHKDLDISLIDAHIIKWYDPKMEMYSWFIWKEDTIEWKSLWEILREAGIETVRIVGLATDYCVRATAIDALRNWFEAIIQSAGVRGVAVSPEDTIAYLQKLRETHKVEYE